MSFDPSVISDIGSSGPDITGSIAKGFQLKDMVDTQQLNQLKLGQAKATFADDQKAKSILSSSKLNTPEGLAEAQEKLTRAGQPDKAMELRKYAQKIESGELDNERQKVELHTAAQDIIAGSVDKIWTQAKAMKDQKTPDGRPKYTDASIDAWIQGQLPLTVSSIQSDSGLPDPVKKTALGGINQFLAQSQGKVTFDMLTQVEQSSKQGHERLKAMRDDLVAQTGARKADVADRGEVERERHDVAMEGLGARKTTDAEKKTATGSFEGKAGELLGALAERGISLPTGLRSKEQMSRTLNSLIERNPQLTVDQIADKVRTGSIDLAAVKKETQVAATQVGKVSLAANELVTFGDQVLEASKGLPRGTTLTGNALLQMGENQISDPKLLRLRVKLQALNNAYDQLAARGGTDADKRAHVHELFNSRLSEAGIQELVKSVKEESEGAEKAAKKTMRVPGSETLPEEGGDHPADIQALLNKYK